MLTITEARADAPQPQEPPALPGRRDADVEGQGHLKSYVCMYVCIYIYIYIYFSLSLYICI